MIYIIAILISITAHANQFGADDYTTVIVTGKVPAHARYEFELNPQLQEQPELSDLLSALPNLSLSSGSNRPRFFQIRGVGETGQFEHSQVGALGVFYEGIDLSEESSTLPLLGRERLRVRYGPQSIDWGGKALAGTVTATSCLDQDCSRQRWQASIANARTLSGSGGSTWSSETLKGFVGVGRTVSDGFYENSFLARPTSKRDETEGVLGLSYHLGDFKVRQHSIFVSHRNGYDSWSFSPSFTTISDHPGQDRHFVHGHSLQIDSGQWQSLTSATFTQQLESYDEDWGNNPYWNTIPGWNADYNYFSAFERHRFKFHQKISRKFGDQAEVGLHFSRYQEKQIIRSYSDEVLRKFSEPDFTTDNLGLWAKKDWLVHDLRIHAGARIEEQWARLVGVGARLNKEMEPLWSGELSIKKIQSSTDSAEFSVARGFRGGGYNTSLGLSPGLLPFGPEQLYLAQLSREHSGADRRWLARVFYQWRQRQQVRSSIQLDPMDPSTFTYYTENQGSSRSYGFEGTLSEQRRHWILSGSVGLMQSRFRNRDLAQAPIWNYFTRLEYAPSHFSGYVQVGGKAGYYLSDDHDYKSLPTHLVDSGVAYRIAHTELRLWVKNIFDQHYPVRAFYFANEPPLWEPKYYTQLGDPRTFGAQVVLDY